MCLVFSGNPPGGLGTQRKRPVFSGFVQGRAASKQQDGDSAADPVWAPGPPCPVDRFLACGIGFWLGALNHLPGELRTHLEIC